MESGLTRRAGRYIDPGDHRYSSRVVRAAEIRRTSEPGWGPISPVCDGTAPHWLVSFYHPPTRVWGAAVELEPISDSSQWNWGFHTMAGGVDPTELAFLPPCV